MKLPRGALTNWLALLTAAAWLIVEIAGWRNDAIGYGGFFAARFGGAELPGALPAILTPLSATLLHDGIAHLGFNLLMLVWCGRFVEQVIGPAPLAFLYIAGAYAAALAQYLVEPTSIVPMIGASGAISAVVGAYAMFYGERRAKAIGPIPARLVHTAWLAAAWIALQALMGIMLAEGGLNIAVAAHVGGFLAGLVLARPLLMWRFRRA